MSTTETTETRERCPYCDRTPATEYEQRVLVAVRALGDIAAVGVPVLAEDWRKRAIDAERECGYLRRELVALRGARATDAEAERRALVLADAVRDYPYPAAAPWDAIEARVDAAIAAYDARAKEAK